MQINFKMPELKSTDLEALSLLMKKEFGKQSRARGRQSRTSRGSSITRSEESDGGSSKMKCEWCETDLVHGTERHLLKVEIKSPGIGKTKRTFSVCKSCAVNAIGAGLQTAVDKWGGQE